MNQTVAYGSQAKVGEGTADQDAPQREIQRRDRS
jgi:hypothetical protein